MTTDTISTFYGLSTETKPGNAKNGSIFIEIDTGKAYMFSADNSQWYEY